MCKESFFCLSFLFFLRSAPILYLSCAFPSICTVSRLLDPPTRAKLPNWQLDWNPTAHQPMPIHFSSLEMWRGCPWRGAILRGGRSLKQSLASQEMDSGVSTKEEKTFTLWGWVLNVRTAGKLGRVGFCQLSTVTRLQRLTYLTCRDHWLFRNASCSEHAREGGSQFFETTWGNHF